MRNVGIAVPSMTRFIRLCSALGLMLLLIVPAAGQPGLLQSGASLIQPLDVPPSLGPFFQVMGSRMTSSDTAQVTLAGTTSDANSSRSAQIVIQAPGYLSYREGPAKALTFNGTQFKSNSGAVADKDQSVLESLMSYVPDALYLQIASGGTLRRIGGHFAPGPAAKGNSGPHWTVYAFSPKPRAGLAQGKALQQNLFICIDETTGLISEVRSVVSSPGNVAPRVIQTQFTGWNQQNKQWFPGQITRLENGLQTLSFTIQQASTGPAIAAASFEP